MSGTVYITPELKTSEHSHLFHDTEGVIRDTFIEELFEDCYYGRELDNIFRHNFAQYFTFLTGYQVAPPADVFDNVSIAKAWVSQNFGLLFCKQASDDEREEAEAEEHGRYFATLRTFAMPETASAFAPSELHAVLLAVVLVYRYLSQQYCGQLFGTPNQPQQANILPV